MAGDTPDRRGSTERRGGAGREAGRAVTPVGSERAVAPARGVPVRPPVPVPARTPPRSHRCAARCPRRAATRPGDAPSATRRSSTPARGGATRSGRPSRSCRAAAPTRAAAPPAAPPTRRVRRRPTGPRRRSRSEPRTARTGTDRDPRTAGRPQLRTESATPGRTAARTPQRVHRAVTDLDGEPRTSRTRAPLKRATPVRGTGRSPVRKATPVRKPRKQSRVRVPRLPRTTRAPKLAEPRRRLRLATVLALLMFAAIGIRLVQLQLTDASAYAAEGLKDRLCTTPSPASRGAILDRTGKILVHSVETRYVAADPMVIKNPEKTADQLFGILDRYGVLRSDLVRKLTPHKRRRRQDRRALRVPRAPDRHRGRRPDRGPRLRRRDQGRPRRAPRRARLRPGLQRPGLHQEE